MQPDKDGNSKQPIFEDMRKNAKQHNPGLQMLMGQ